MFAASQCAGSVNDKAIVLCSDRDLLYSTKVAVSLTAADT